MAKKPCDCGPGKMTFEQWAASGGAVPMSYKGREKAWANQVRKYAEGGSVSPAAQIDGDEFVEAAKAYGLGTDNNTLNKIVARVNRGESVREAARAVAQSLGTGESKMQAGGIAKLAKLLKGTQETLPAAERQANLAKFIEPSKVPQRLYHGTTASEGGKGAESIRRFKPSKEGALGSGVYMTPKPTYAGEYTSGAGGNMLPVYAQIKNPLVIEGKGDPMIEALIKLGIDENKAVSMVERAYENKGYIGKEVESRARAAGYDGLMQYRDGDLSEVVSYNPNAVKSAIGNKGTYDTNKPDLNEAAGGAVHMQAGGLSKLAKALKGSQKADDAAKTSLGEVGSMVTKMGEEGRSPIVPVPNRWFLYPDKFPHQQKMVERVLATTGKKREDFPSGAFIDPRTGEVLDSRIMNELGVVIDPKTNRPMMSAKGELGIERIDPKLGAFTKSNLVRKGLFKPEGGDPLLNDLNFLATIEKGDVGHKYGLATEYASPAELWNTGTGANPTLRPRSRGDLFGVGDVVGQVRVGRSEPHDVYEKLFVAPKGSDVQGVKLSKAEGGEIHMDKGGKVEDKAYVGYRRAGRRPESQQDREASANIPVAVARGLVSGALGMPGDIESLVRIPYDYLRSPTMSELVTGDKTSKTILPTSEDIEKRLPFRGASQTPVGEMFTGAGQLAGGFYTGPGSGARAALAVPRAIKRAGRDFFQAAGQPAVNVISKNTDYSQKVLDSTVARFAEKIARDNPKLTAEEVSKKALTQATKKLDWERTQKPALEKRYGELVKSSYADSNPIKQQNTPAVVQERMRRANEFLDQPTAPWTPPRPELQAFDRSSIKDALEGFPGVEQSRFPRDKPTRANIEHVEELYSDPANRALIGKQIKRGLPLGGETFYASLYPVKLATLEKGMPAEKFEQWIHGLAPASARNSIMNEMSVGQFLRDMNSRGIPLTEENVAREMAAYKEKFGIGLPLMPIHRQGVANVLEGGQNLREMNLANIPTNYKIPTYGTQKAGDFKNSVVLDVHEAGGQTQGSRFHPYFNEQGGFGNTEYGAGEQGLLGIAQDLGIPGGMAQAGRWFGGGELTGLKSPRGDALDLLEKQVAYTLKQKGIQPNPANVRAEVLRQIETGQGDLLPWYRKEGMPDVRETGLQRAEGGDVHMADGGAAFGVFPQMPGKRGQRVPRQEEKTFVDERAMELPAFGDVDLSVPTAANRVMSDRMRDREISLKAQADADTSPLEKIAGGMQTARLFGSGMLQAIKSIPTAITKGGKAAEDYIAKNIYKPTQPKAYEYAGDVGNFLEQLETKYKIPPVIPELLALQGVTGPAARQAKRATTATDVAKKNLNLGKNLVDTLTSSKISTPPSEAKAAQAGIPTGATYATKQEGPFFRVSPTTLDVSKAKSRGIREADELQGQVPVGGSTGQVGGELPTRIADEEVARIIADPVANEPLNIAKKYTQETQGTDFVLPQIPESSLVKQSAIGRTHQLAVEGAPEYKTAVFDAYAKQMPDVLEQAGAKNYDDLMEKAYRQLAKETDAQFRALPYNFSYHRAGEGNYNSSKEMAADVHGNKHLYVFQGGDPHDFLNRVDPNTGLNENEKFRAVHDLLGHAIYGNQFGPKGEETAWAIHSQMYSPLARLAMTAETRGQNSMVNYSPLNANLKAEIAKYDSMAYEARRRGDKGLLSEINAAKRQAYSGFQFAPQKAVLLPPEFLSPQYAGGMPSYLATINRPAKGTETQSVLTHFSNEPNLQFTDPRRYGSGIKGAEGERLREYPGAVRDRSYFYMGEPGSVIPEPGLGANRYRGESSSLYDITQDPLSFRALARESNRVPYTAKYNQGVTYPLQEANDMERLVKEYGYEGMANPKASKPMAIMFNETPVRRQKSGGLTSIK